MAEQDRTPTRCDLCETRDASGVDEQGYPMCDYCAGRMRGGREEDRRLLSDALRRTLEWVRQEGLSAQEIRSAVDAELDVAGRTDALLEQLEQQLGEGEED